MLRLLAPVGAAPGSLRRNDVTDIIDIRSTSPSDEADRFAQLWRDTAWEDDEGDAGLLRAAMAQKPLVIHAERV